MAEATLYSRRIEQEWSLLQELARINPKVLEIVERRRQADGDLFRIVLHETCSIAGWKGSDPVLVRSHPATFRFPRFFPSVPIEAIVVTPVFHPNIDPLNGFVCLWTRSSPGDTVMEAARRLQQIIAWKSVNFDVEHVMQPEAVRWFQDPSHSAMAPFEYTPLVESGSFRLEKSFAERQGAPRRRLEPI